MCAKNKLAKPVVNIKLNAGWKAAHKRAQQVVFAVVVRREGCGHISAVTIAAAGLLQQNVKRVHQAAIAIEDLHKIFRRE